MTPYFFTFILSTWFVYLGEKSKNKNRRFYYIFFILAVLIVSFLAGVRDLNIGTDVYTYGEWEFKAAKNMKNIIQCLTRKSEIEPLYRLFVYFISRFANDSHWLYFFTGIFIYGFTLAGLNYYHRKISMPFAWLVYLLLYYGDTLNIMRQFMAISLMFWGFKFAIEHKYKTFILVFLVAFMIHNTAIIFLGIYWIYRYLQKNDTFYKKVLIVLESIVLLVSYGYLLKILSSFGIINERFERYLNASFLFQINPIIVRIPFIILIVLFLNRFYKNNSSSTDSLDGKYEADFLVIALILEMFTAEMRAVLPALYRFSYFFYGFKSIAYTRLLVVFNKKSRLIVGFTILAFLVVWWIYGNVIQGNNEIYPYTSSILGI